MFRWTRIVIASMLVAACLGLVSTAASATTSASLNKYCTSLYKLPPVPTIPLTNTDEATTQGTLGTLLQIISGFTHARQYAPTSSVTSALNRAIVKLQDETIPLYALNNLLSELRGQGISSSNFAAQWRAGAIKANALAVLAKPMVAFIGEGGEICTLSDDTYSALSRVQNPLLVTAANDSWKNTSDPNRISVANVARATAQVGAFFPVRLISTAPQFGLVTSARFALTVAGRVVDICVTFRDRPATQTPYKLLAC